ncbi:hypothetical protein AAIR98_000333 [Elusimicrobium simillimum]|uniref:hypothetical protein n=1 Tax=Elusimicrobium simillimum TaxID=3143438 RepID=UPI003C7002CA
MHKFPLIKYISILSIVEAVILVAIVLAGVVFNALSMNLFFVLIIGVMVITVITTAFIVFKAVQVKNEVASWPSEQCKVIDVQKKGFKYIINVEDKKTNSVFTSLPIMFNPAKAIENDNMLTVYINPRNPLDYFVDVTKYAPKR